ncbi:MAG TPA: hypothetical protein DEG06_08235 [Lachnospiraceae bacterium]|nr:hypothetical protein [Lachnospiraceae bacterium]HBY72214.1 hypothetical protein [Lachnospiraceae bacterium]HCA70590.1 hypothetical protein [Lachnospiraceae bacterium]HCM11758.1 hypothetical protein [Lachnospiraceae bacterium]HCR39335.1 hypothetical protein [Lachnospiraceae bacterium]
MFMVFYMTHNTPIIDETSQVKSTSMLDKISLDELIHHGYYTFILANFYELLYILGKFSFGIEAKKHDV